MSRYPSDCKVYVGDLGNSATKQELEDAFSHYGPLKNVWVARNPPGFAFVEFEDARDAEDAVKALDGRTVCGRRARVELSNGERSRDRGGSRRGGAGSNRPFHPEHRCYDCGERGHYARDCSRQRGGARRRRFVVHSTPFYTTVSLLYIHAYTYNMSSTFKILDILFSLFFFFLLLLLMLKFCFLELNKQ